MINTLNLYDKKYFNLPYHGWIKVCVVCSKPTSSFTTQQHYDEKIYKIHVCYDCKQKPKNIEKIKKNLYFLIKKSDYYREN